MMVVAEPRGAIVTADQPPDPLVIDCDTCVLQDTSACVDCVVTFFCDRPQHEPVVVSLDEVRALRTLSGAGLVPRLRHTAR
jgi:hypothetical protein